MGQGKQGEDEERARWGQGLRQGQGRPGQGQGDSKVHMSNNYTLLLVILDLLGSTRVLHKQRLFHYSYHTCTR